MIHQSPTPTSVHSVVKFLPSTTRSLGLLLIAATPWLYGATRPAMVSLLLHAGTGVIILWIATCLLQRRAPRLPPLPALAAVLLAAQATFLAWNASGIFDTVYWQPLPRLQPFPGAPAAFDLDAASHAAHRFAVLLGLFLFFLDGMADPRWRHRWLTAAAASAGALAFLGLLQKATGATDIFWGPRHLPGGLFFATFRYHGNAGAFFNLAWPLVLWAAWNQFYSRPHPLLQTFWTLATLASTCALFLNGSRAATLLALPLLAVWFLLHRRRLAALASHLRPPVRLFLSSFLLLAVAAMATAGFIQSTGHRLEALLRNQSSLHDRILAWQSALPMVREAPAFGIGPGCFKWRFPFHTLPVGDDIAGFWRYLHNDYLQTLIEWGAVGASLWAILFFGGPMLAWKRLPNSAPPDRLLLRACLLAWSVTALHALADFPFQIFSLQLYTLLLLSALWQPPAHGYLHREDHGSGGSK